MKRRTNLFYTSGPDSKFLTFSNYTEALTGNIISTDTKLFPSKFLCLKINGLNSSSKESFINFLMRYYENKLATIKDYLISANKVVENLYPLSYLLEAICYATKFNDNDELELDLNSSNDPFNIDKEKLKFNQQIISYIGDISEEDYNGSYTDIICCIDMNKYNVGYLIKNEESDENIIISDDGDKDDNSNIIRYLHGWKNFNQDFNGVNVSLIRPIFDNGSTSYELVNKIKTVKITELINESKLEFNIIIPLFDVVDINYKTNNTQIIESDEIEITTTAKYNLPLGIWLYADKDEDTFITLEKDPETGMYPSWSLLISSQFKPFPYSNKIVNNANSSMLGNSFSTFSEVLTRMNMILNKFSELENRINNINNDIKKIKSDLSDIGTENSITDLKMKIESYKNSTNNDIQDLENKILSYISNLKWSSVG